MVDAYLDPGKLKQSSADAIQWHLLTTLAPWKDKPIASITEDACRKPYHKLKVDGLQGDGGAPGESNQAFSVLRALINFAMRR